MSKNFSMKKSGGKGPAGMITSKPKDLKKTLKKLMFYLKGFWWQIIIGLVFAGISTVLAILGPDKLSELGTLLLGTTIEFNTLSSLSKYLRYGL